jgi:hypothetical protein
MSAFQNIEIGTGALPAPYMMTTGAPPAGVKRPVSEANRTPACSRRFVNREAVP